jgi:hypothetical protein
MPFPWFWLAAFPSMFFFLDMLPSISKVLEVSPCGSCSHLVSSHTFCVLTAFSHTSEGCLRATSSKQC